MKDKATSQGVGEEKKASWLRLGDHAEPEKRIGDEMPHVPVEEKIRSQSDGVLCMLHCICVCLLWIAAAEHAKFDVGI